MNLTGTTHVQTSNRPRVVLLGAFPVQNLPESGVTGLGYHSTWLERVAASLSRVDFYDVHWITFSKAASSKVSFQALNQTFHVFPRKWMSLQIVSKFVLERMRLKSLLKELDPDIVHSWGTEDAYGLAAVDWAGTSFISMQGILKVCCDTAPQHWLLKAQERNERTVFKKGKFFTIESSWGMQKMREAGVTVPIKRVEYGVGEDCFAVERAPTAKPTCLFVGTLYELKGVDTLLKAFADPRLEGIDLVLLGSGRLRIPDDECPPNIRFLGHLPQEEVRSWMSKAWSLVHPTLADTSPNCVKEARVIGLPVVTTPCGGQTQYVEHGASGWIHEPGDIEGLIEGVLKVTESQERSLEMGEAGREACRAELRPEKTVQAFDLIYKELMEEANK